MEFFRDLTPRPESSSDGDPMLESSFLGGVVPSFAKVIDGSVIIPLEERDETFAIISRAAPYRIEAPVTATRSETLSVGYSGTTVKIPV